MDVPATNSAVIVDYQEQLAGGGGSSCNGWVGACLPHSSNQAPESPARFTQLKGAVSGQHGWWVAEGSRGEAEEATGSAPNADMPCRADDAGWDASCSMKHDTNVCQVHTAGGDGRDWRVNCAAGRQRDGHKMARGKQGCGREVGVLAGGCVACNQDKLWEELIALEVQRDRCGHAAGYAGIPEVQEAARRSILHLPQQAHVLWGCWKVFMIENEAPAR